jgi:hypothetical protein
MINVDRARLILILIALIAVVSVCVLGAWYVRSVPQHRTDPAAVYIAAMANRNTFADSEMRVVGLAGASKDDLAQAFVYANVAFFPNADLLYVRRADAQDQHGDLLDHAGHLVATVDYYDPDFSGDPSSGLFPARREFQQVGYIDGRGAWAIEAKFQWAQPFKNGIALVHTAEGTGTIDVSGKWITPPGNKDDFPVEPDRPHAPTLYETLDRNKDGLLARCDGLQCGYVNESGTWAIAAQFDEAGEFHNGVARVVKNGLVSYADIKGQLLTAMPPQSALAPWLWRPDSVTGNPSDGERTVFGYLGRDGKWAIAPVFSASGDFHGKLAPALSATGRYGFISPDGNWGIPPIFDRASSFSEGWAAVCGSRFFDNCGYVDAHGMVKLKLPVGVHDAGDFANGKAEVIGEDGRKAVIDKSGKIVARAIADGDQADTTALRRLSVNGGKWGFADAQDHFVIEPQFDDAGDFSGDYAPVMIDKKWGYVDRGGKIAISPAYDEVARFSEGFAAVRQGEAWNFIDSKGQAMPTEPLTFAGEFHDGMAKAAVNLDAVKRRAAGSGKPEDKLPDFISAQPIMLADGGDMRAGITWIKLTGGGSNGAPLLGLLNKRGELVIPTVSRHGRAAVQQ